MSKTNEIYMDTHFFRIGINVNGCPEFLCPEFLRYSTSTVPRAKVASFIQAAKARMRADFFEVEPGGS